MVFLISRSAWNQCGVYCSSRLQSVYVFLARSEAFLGLTGFMESLVSDDDDVDDDDDDDDADDDDVLNFMSGARKKYDRFL